MASAGLQKLFDEIKAVVLEADELFGRADAAPAPGSAEESAPAVPERAEAPGEKLRASAGRAADTTVDLVREHPWQALGVAVLAGFVVGWLAKRK